MSVILHIVGHRLLLKARLIAHKRQKCLWIVKFFPFAFPYAKIVKRKKIDTISAKAVNESKVQSKNQKSIIIDTNKILLDSKSADHVSSHASVASLSSSEYSRLAK